MTSPPTKTTRPKAIVVWCLTDEKPGHWNQLRGLTRALEQLVPLDLHTVSVLSKPGLLRKISRFFNGLIGRFPAGATLPAPDLIFACGHATHFPLLAAKKQYGGKSILLMKPSIPCSYFDLCFIPEHDSPSLHSNIVTTMGVLNAVPAKQSTVENKEVGLILIGGPSSHHLWDEENILSQVRAIQSREANRQFVLTTSRRTPQSTVDQLLKLATDRFQIVPAEQTNSNWLLEQYAKAHTIFVTEDSVSMIYESLTSGAAVCLLSVPKKNEGGRVAKGVENLLQKQVLCRFETWKLKDKITPPLAPFREADRCAQIVFDRLLSSY